MKILVIGSEGNMGRRYMAILKYLGHEAIGMDLGDQYPDPDSFDRAIIAATTETHYNICYSMAHMGKSFLCEKPIAEDPGMIQKLINDCADDKDPVDGRMVCNWSFAGRVRYDPGCHRVQYSNYNTGKDGLAWDCIQLIYLANGFPQLSTGSPFLQAHIDEDRIHEGMIAMSYKKMVEAWIQDPNQLWSLEDAKKASEKVIRYMEVNK